MKTLLPALLLSLLLFGCANGPTHDYYNPAIVGAHFKGPVTIEQVGDVDATIARLTAQGYSVIGSTRYGGKYPETVELIAQAKRVGANHVVYHSDFRPAAPGSWHFGFGNGAGFGGTDTGSSVNYIAFLGK